ncbi:hypothetical protein [Mucilaginibacter terrigena]|uniref:hypothetical protein n=1 Tax=Mucilaginibacter terrigena TaxID=2492395 RepID=UPI0013969979|nr:hypothetical protein [Mucilaginibacter terrigena]
MKKIIIAAALVLTSAITAFSLTTRADNNTEAAKISAERANVTVVSPSSAPKSDIATAD